MASISFCPQTEWRRLQPSKCRRWPLPERKWEGMETASLKIMHCHLLVKDNITSIPYCLPESYYSQKGLADMFKTTGKHVLAAISNVFSLQASAAKLMAKCGQTYQMRKQPKDLQD